MSALAKTMFTETTNLSMKLTITCSKVQQIKERWKLSFTLVYHVNWSPICMPSKRKGTLLAVYLIFSFSKSIQGCFVECMQWKSKVLLFYLGLDQDCLKQSNPLGCYGWTGSHNKSPFTFLPPPTTQPLKNIPILCNSLISLQFLAVPFLTKSDLP